MRTARPEEKKIVTDFFPDEGAAFGSLNKPATTSRWTIGDLDFDDCINWVIFPEFLQQVLGPTSLAQLPNAQAPFWASAQPLNNATFIFALGSNGHLYQISVSGTITDTFTASTFTESGVLNGTITVTGLASTANIIVGGGVTGTDIQPGTKVASIVSSSSITLTLAATGSITTPLTFTPPLISSASDIANWMGQEILISDSGANALYQWNGTTLSQVFTNQPIYYMAVFGGRLWFTNGQGLVQFTAAGTYNSLGGDAGNFTIVETDCPGPIQALVPLQGVLYIVGQSWVQMIGNLYETTIGSLSQLNFTRNTAINQVGAITKWGISSFDYLMLFPVQTGIWSYYGSQANWMSEKVGGFFQNLILGNTSFSAGFGIIQQLPCLFWNICWSNNGVTEYTILALDVTSIGGPLRWMRFIPQTGGGTNIPIAFITSGLDQVNRAQKVWGFDTSGNLYQLFANASINVTSVANTKLWNLGSRIRVKSVERGGALVVSSSNASYNVSAIDENLINYTPYLQSVPPSNVVTWVYNSGATATWKYSGGAAVTWFKVQALQAQLEWYIPLQARNVGFNFSMTGINCYLYAFGIEYEETPADWGN